MSQAWPQGFKKPPEKCSGAWGPIFDIYRSILVRSNCLVILLKKYHETTLSCVKSKQVYFPLVFFR